MENNQHINTFDAMLKQSLEGSQMPVPAGVWEAVGSSIGTKAIVATKIAGLKLLILKTLAGIVLAGGAGFGIYELVKTNTNETVKIDQPIIVNQSSPLEMAIDTVFPAQISESDNTVTRKFVLNEDSMITYSKTETSGAKESENSNFDNNVPKATEVAVPKPLIETKAPEKQVEPNKVAEPTKEAPKTEPIVTPAFPEPPNVFTPDSDGINDCFKIEVENEKMFFLQIFSSEGKKVFETTDKNNCWNGVNMNTGELCKKGLYTYKLLYELNTGFKKKESRWLTLL
jgi:gliding motility-associated-like protein